MQLLATLGHSRSAEVECYHELTLTVFVSQALRHFARPDIVRLASILVKDHHSLPYYYCSLVVFKS